MALLLALLSLGALAFPGLAFAEPTRLSVDDAVRIAVERNLGLQVETYNPAIAGTDIQRARSIYDPTLSALLDSRGYKPCSEAALVPALWVRGIARAAGGAGDLDSGVRLEPVRFAGIHHRGILAAGFRMAAGLQPPEHCCCRGSGSAGDL